MRNKGFTIIEIVIVVAVLAIVTSIAVPNFLKQHERSSLEADAISLFSLNDATESYARVHNIDIEVVFDEYGSDRSRLDQLINTGFLLMEPEVQTQSAEFVWNESKNEWNLDNAGESISLEVATSVPTSVPTAVPTATPTPVPTATIAPTIAPTNTPAATTPPSYPYWSYWTQYWPGNIVTYNGQVYKARRLVGDYDWRGRWKTHYPWETRYWRKIS